MHNCYRFDPTAFVAPFHFVWLRSKLSGKGKEKALGALWLVYIILVCICKTWISDLSLPEHARYVDELRYHTYTLLIIQLICVLDWNCWA